MFQLHPNEWNQSTTAGNVKASQESDEQGIGDTYHRRSLIIQCFGVRHLTSANERSGTSSRSAAIAMFRHLLTEVKRSGGKRDDVGHFNCWRR